MSLNFNIGPESCFPPSSLRERSFFSLATVAFTSFHYSVLRVGSQLPELRKYHKWFDRKRHLISVRQNNDPNYTFQVTPSLHLQNELTFGVPSCRLLPVKENFLCRQIFKVS